MPEIRKMLVSVSRNSFFPSRLCGSIFLCFAAVAPVHADASKKITYQDDLMPVLRNSCLNCHNPDKKKAGLDLSTYAALMTGSENGKIIKPGDPSTSPLIKS